jgi:sec-independent protein translocase protein TatB
VFDVGFSELMVIAVVALIVIGPERLPKVARTMGHLFGRLQRYVNDVKADIQREMEFEELRKFKSTFEDAAEDAARSVENAVQGEVAKTEGELGALAEIADPHEAGPGAAAAVPGNPASEAPAPQPEARLDSTSDPASPAKKTAA